MSGGWWPRVPLWLQKAVFITGAVSAPIALVLGIRDLFGIDGPGWAILLAFSSAVLTVGSLTAVYVIQFRHANAMVEQERWVARELELYRRNAAAAAALPEFHQAFHALRDAAVLIDDGNDEAAYRETMIRSLAHLAMVFSTITRSPCRVCIKELRAAHDAPDEQLSAEDDIRYFGVQTLYRHDGSYRPEKDDWSPLHENSDFAAVWDRNQTRNCFFSNDLDKEQNYVNAHRSGKADEVEYNAAIVWPIRRRKAHEPERYSILGFLCVDTLSREVFQYQTDFEIGAAYADTLFTVMALRDRETSLRSAPDRAGEPKP